MGAGVGIGVVGVESGNESVLGTSRSNVVVLEPITSAGFTLAPFVCNITGVVAEPDPRRRRGTLGVRVWEPRM